MTLEALEVLLWPEEEAGAGLVFVGKGGSFQRLLPSLLEYLFHC